MPEREQISAEAVRAPGRRSSLRSARWFAAEIVVVTVGILIALTLDAWWSELKDADRARSYLVRIHEDLSSDGEALDKRLTYFASVERYAESAIAYAETGTLRNGSAWETVIAFFHAGQIWPYFSTTRTYGEMLSTGDLRLIQDADLRAALATYYDESEVSQGAWIFGLIPEYRTRIRGITPLPVQRYMFASCIRQDSYDNQVLVDCDAPVSDVEALAILERFLSAPGLVEDLRYWASNLIVTAIIMNLTRDAAGELAGRVAGHAGLGGP